MLFWLIWTPVSIILMKVLVSIFNDFIVHSILCLFIFSFLRFFRCLSTSSLSLFLLPLRWLWELIYVLLVRCWCRCCISLFLGGKITRLVYINWCFLWLLLLTARVSHCLLRLTTLVLSLHLGRLWWFSDRWRRNISKFRPNLLLNKLLTSLAIVWCICCCW